MTRESTTATRVCLVLRCAAASVEETSRAASTNTPNAANRLRPAVLSVMESQE